MSIQEGRERGIGEIHGVMLQCELHSITNENTFNKLQARVVKQGWPVVPKGEIISSSGEDV
jgi:hypothetical protein